MILLLVWNTVLGVGLNRFVFTCLKNFQNSFQFDFQALAHGKEFKKRTLTIIWVHENKPIPQPVSLIILTSFLANLYTNRQRYLLQTPAVTSKKHLLSLIHLNLIVMDPSNPLMKLNLQNCWSLKKMRCIISLQLNLPLKMTLFMIILWMKKSF